MSTFDYADVVADLKERRMLIDRAIESLEGLTPRLPAVITEPVAVRAFGDPSAPTNGVSGIEVVLTEPDRVLLSQRPLPPDDGIDIGSPIAIAKREAALAATGRPRRALDSEPAKVDEAAIETVVAEAEAPKRRGPWRPCPNPKCGKWRRGLSTKCVHCGAKAAAA